MKKIGIIIFTCLVLWATKSFASSDPYSFSKTKAFCLFQQGDYERAIYLYEKIVRSTKSDVNVFYNLGCLYVKIEEYDLAVKTFEKVVLSMSPLAKDALYNLSVIYGKHFKDKPKAMQYYSRYVRISKSMELSYVDN